MTTFPVKYLPGLISHHFLPQPVLFNHRTPALWLTRRLCAYLLCWNSLLLDTHTASSSPSPGSLLKGYLMRGLLP